MTSSATYMNFYLRVVNFDIPHVEISKLLNLNPTDTHIKGEKVKNSRIERIAEFNLWEFEIKNISNSSLDENINHVLDENQNFPKIQKLDKKMEIIFSFVIYDSNRDTILTLEADTLVKLSKCSASLDIDILTYGINEQ